MSRVFTTFRRTRMDLGAQISEAVRQELERQAEASEGDLTVEELDAEVLAIDGKVDLASLAMAIAGAVAGGP
jgi:hypothetical protein